MAQIISSRSFNLSWGPPLPEQRNGIIIRYTINVLNTNTNQNLLVYSTRLNLTFPSGLVTVQPYRTYILQVAAETSEGRGPYTTDTIVFTPQDRKSNPTTETGTVVAKPLHTIQ